MGLIIENIVLFSNVASDNISANYAVAMDGNKIIASGPTAELSQKYPDFSRLDGQSKLLMPGWINPHMHFYGSFARGMALQKSPHGFKEILEQLWWRLDQVLDAESNYFSALVPMITAIKNGVTSVIDHHSSPNAIDGSLDRIAHALDRAGLRAVLCYEVSDRNGHDQALAGLKENERFIKKARDLDLVTGMIGLHASFTLSDQTLEASADLGNNMNTGFHIHLAEGKADDAYPEYGVSTTERLSNFNILGPQTIAAHAIYISDSDRDLLKASETMVVHNPQSNMNNAVGRADIFSLLEAGILTGLGTDGMSASLAGDIRAADLVHKHDLRDNRVGWAEVQKMTLNNNRKIFERVSGRKLGQIKPGQPADLILIDYYPPTPLSTENIWGHLLFGILDAQVDTTIVNGRILMQNKQLQSLDEQEIAAKARELAKKVWQKL